MPRNSGGVYTPPTGTYGVSGTPISSTAYDAFINDLSTELTNSFNVQGTAPMLAPLNMGGYKIVNGADPVAATDLTTKEYVDTIIPAGMIIAMSGNYPTPPTGYLICNGASISTTTYANLFAYLGYAYGGSGSSFFIPDFRGCFLRGFDNSRGLDPNGTRAPNAFQAQAIINHFHNISDPGHAHNHSDPGHNHSQSGHSHGVTDPQHFHTIPNAALTGSGTTLSSGFGFNLTSTNATNFSATGISIQAQVANINAATTGISISAAATGVHAVDVSTGTVIETRPVNYPVLWCIKY